MSFPKVIFSNELPDELVLQSGRIATFFDGSTLIKSAASSAFSENLIRDHMPDKGYFGVHLIAMGASEHYGFNKNGDWFGSDMLKRCHPTFVTHGNVFREHLNQDPKKRIGIVKASGYNDEMERVELIVWIEIKKAEQEYQMAKSGKELSFSMSIRVPYDTCSCCDNKAKQSRHYCTHLKRHMGQWIEKYSKFAYAINPDGTFFDISKVKNPADRIAHYLEYFFGKEEGIRKAASADRIIIFGDQRAEAEGLNLPNSYHGFLDRDKQQLLEKLAREERYVQAFWHTPQNVCKDEKFYFTKESAAYAFDNDAVTEEQVAALRKVEPDIMLRHFAKRASVLPFKAFAAWVTGKTLAETANDPVYKQAAAKHLPNIFNTLLNSPIDPDIENLFDIASHAKAACECHGDDVQQLMDRVAEDYSVDKPLLKIRIIRICATRPGGVKIASMNSPLDVDSDTDAAALKLASAYGIYKVAFCQAVNNLHGHECIDDAIALLLTYQHL